MGANDLIATTYVLIGTVLLTAAILLFTFAARIAVVIGTLLDGAPGIPFRRGAARNSSSRQIRAAGVVAVLMAGVFFFQAAVRSANAAPTDPNAATQPVIAIAIGSAVLATSQLTLGLLSVLKGNEWAAAIERRADQEGRDKAAVSSKGLIVFGCGCFLLLVPSVAIFFASI
ncbi:hypothetical protein LQ938_11675 [Microbacterium sp. cx-55]|uniref:hypothetical protein n=1 Tax=Microbacterium sp. cx-55 TaxID=2875948 RepID=UPI001CC0A087|nr:hypothetical protein [Microbacterium sp. cx-55]MBZ4488069.1 hypothetical protein [Microbacterium sp. cx-55]UGB34525.1 hypothetical protein LQ938_11675 [Microbacterium sp. cx-55]